MPKHKVGDLVPLFGIQTRVKEVTVNSLSIYYWLVSDEGTEAFIEEGSLDLFL